MESFHIHGNQKRGTRESLYITLTSNINNEKYKIYKKYSGKQYYVYSDMIISKNILSRAPRCLKIIFHFFFQDENYNFILFDILCSSTVYGSVWLQEVLYELSNLFILLLKWEINEKKLHIYWLYTICSCVLKIITKPMLL